MNTDFAKNLNYWVIMPHFLIFG